MSFLASLNKFLPLAGSYSTGRKFSRYSKPHDGTTFSSGGILVARIGLSKSEMRLDRCFYRYGFVVRRHCTTQKEVLAALE